MSVTFPRWEVACIGFICWLQDDWDEEAHPGGFILGGSAPQPVSVANGDQSEAGKTRHLFSEPHLGIICTLSNINVAVFLNF